MKPGDELAEEMLGAIRREFFAKWPEKRFYQERNLLLQAVTFPARYLHDRGASLPAAKYRAIIQTVIDAIKGHGNRAKIVRFSAYFLHSVQAHMSHHGNEYYEASKALPTAGSFVPGVMCKIRSGEPPDRTIETLAAVHRTLRSRGGRKRRIPEAKNLDLFASGNGPASRLRDR